MRGGLPRSWCGLAVVTLLGACSNIIGISSYEIDPALDDGGGGSITNSGGSHAGTHNVDGGDPNLPAGGDGTGGSSVGGKNTGGSAVAGAPAAGETGTGGEPSPPGCQTAQDCDDTIDCTTDTCNAGTCVHTPKNTLCDSSLCETCQVGIGCVAGSTTSMQMLLDPNFDAATGDWVEKSKTFGKNIFTNAMAQSADKIAKFGPAGAAASGKQEYADLYQYVSMPPGIVGLSLTGYFKATPGTKAPADDYVVAAFYAIGTTDPFTQFHSFEASAGAQATWKAFTYSAPKAEVALMGGNDYTFDLVAHVWDSVFQFDTLQLNATVCQ